MGESHNAKYLLAEGITCLFAITERSEESQYRTAPKILRRIYPRGAQGDRRLYEQYITGGEGTRKASSAVVDVAVVQVAVDTLLILHIFIGEIRAPLLFLLLRFGQ